MKVQLITPNQDVGRSFNAATWWPQGLLSIASYCHQKDPYLDIEIIDGEITPKENLKKKIQDSNARIIGISCNSFNYQNGLEIVRLAKSLEKKVYMGGPHASAVAEQILKNQPDIDAVIRYDGERAFNDLLHNKPFSEIQNLVYRNGDEIVSNALVLEHLSQNLEIDFSLIDMAQYQKNHKEQFPFLPEKAILYFTHIGCDWRARNKGCIFCASPEPKLVFQSPEKVWQDFKRFKELYEIEIVKDYGDTITADAKWIRSFLKARPTELSDMMLMVYGSARDIDDEMAGLLQKLNVKYVFVGFESGDNKILQNLRKGTTAKQNWDSARRLIDNGIGIFASYILGSPGETEETIQRTHDLAARIAEYGNGKGPNGRNLVELSNASPFIPIPGSCAYDNLEHKSDTFDCGEAIKEHISRFCDFTTDSDTSYNKILETCKNISLLSPQKNYLGWDKNDKN